MAKEVKNVLVDEDYWRLTEYKAWGQPEFTAIIDITTTDTYTPLFGMYVETDSIKEMYIDGVLLDEPVKQYTFDTLGEHTIRVVFVKGTSMSQVLDTAPIVHLLDVKYDNGFRLCYNASQLKTVNLDSFVKTNEIIYAYGMFNYCINLIEVDLSPLKGVKISYASEMFSSCKNLTSIDLSPLIFEGDNILCERMFSGCVNLKSIKMMSDVSKVKNVSYMFGQNDGKAGANVENPKFYYDARYDYSKIIAELPENWTAIPVYE